MDHHYPTTPFEPFAPDTSRELRDQILRYHIACVMTDAERAKLFGLPSNCRMREGAKILSPENLLCGEYVWIGENAILDASGGLTIGSHTSIGLSVFVWTHSSDKLNAKMENRPHHPEIQRKSTRIGHGCFIAGPSVILPGCTIGDRAVIGPMSVVDRDVADGEVIFGVRGVERHVRRLNRTIEALIVRLDQLEKELRE